MTDPRPYLDRVGIPWDQVTDPGYGYDGTFQPAGCFAHWTASGRSTDTAEAVLVQRHYHACASRTGRLKLGGWNVRQGHGGNGRTQPLQLARDGRMTLEQLGVWQADQIIADNTSSWPNQYFLACCIDNDGIGEVPSNDQWQAWVAGCAAFLAALGKNIGSFVDHDASTNRKIDCGHSPAWTADRYWNDIDRYVGMMTGEEPAVDTNKVCAFELAPAGGGGGALFPDGRLITRGHEHYGDLPYPKTGAPAQLVVPPAVDFSWTPSGKGYTIIDAGGYTWDFGDAVHQEPYKK